MQADRSTLRLISALARSKGRIELPAKGSSMHPYIRNGEVCRFFPCRASALKKGDVALFRSADGRLIAHRYCRSFAIGGERRYVFKGDANGGFDEPVGPESVIGRLAAIERDGKFQSVQGVGRRLQSWMLVQFPRLSGRLRTLNAYRVKLFESLRPSFTLREIRTAYGLVLPYALRFRKGYIALFALMLLDILLTVAFARLFGSLLDAAVHGDGGQLKRLIPIGAGLFLMNAASTYWGTFLEAWVVNGVKQRMTEDLYKQLLLLPITGDTVRSGEWLTHFTNEIHGMDGMIGRGLLTMIRLPVTYATVLLYLLHVGGRLALLSLAAAPAAIAGGAIFGFLLRRSGRSVLRLWGEANTLLNETIYGLPVIRSFTREALFLERFTRYNRQLYALEQGNARLNGRFRAGGYGLSAASYLASLGMGAYSIAQGTMTVGSLLTFLNLVHYLVEPLTGLAGQWAGLQRSVAAMERLSAVFAQRSDAKELPVPLPGRPVRKAICFEQVTFGYEEGSPPLFEGLELSIPAGKTIAIVGPSGSGKTTLLHLLQGFCKPWSGCIRIDGVPLDKRSPSELSSLFAHVSQDTFLFAGTIRDNLLFARPGITQAELVQAAMDAQIHAFIQSLPQGYETEVGERGIRLSGGQRQRIAIARALLKNAPILLLDEATSALDNETEQEVKRALERLMKQRTTLLVTHRMSMTEHADIIVKLGQGGIVERIGEEAAYAYDGPASCRL